MKKMVQALALLFCSAAPLQPVWADGNYKSFTIFTYATLGTVEGLLQQNPDPEQSWDTMTKNLKVDKIYLEVMRNRTMVSDEDGLEKLKAFYKSKGVKISGGLAYSVSERNGYQGFDYADPADRAFVQHAVEVAAKHFDEVLLDDYYFFDRKTDLDIKAKGNRSWSQFRLDTMRDVTENLIVKPAKAINPSCRVIIKMANWYDQYASMGNDTEKVPLTADGMFCGTESRTWVGQEQHLQPYQSYDIMRFMDNLKPGVNQGGWVDQGGANPIDRYSEELLDTVFARCPEMCCFNYGAMISPIRAAAPRPWADQPTTLNLAEVQKTIAPDAHPTFADIAGYTLARADKVLAQLGKPQGIKCYTPYHATGEEFLHDYLGMIGLPMDIFPAFPADADLVLLSEQAKSDPDIIHKIQNQLLAGKSVCITSGFLRAMQGKGIQDLCEIENTGATVAIGRFSFAGGPGAPFRGRGSVSATNPTTRSFDPLSAPRDLLIPEIKYANILTHDAWGDVVGVSPAGTTYPILLSCDYSKGKLFILNIPVDPADLYAFPPAVLSVIRGALGGAEPTPIDTAPAQVALFRYDNGTFIVQNYLPTSAEVSVSVAGHLDHIQDLIENKVIAPAPEPLVGRAFNGGSSGRAPVSTAPVRTSFAFKVLPHSYAAFATRLLNAKNAQPQ